MAEFSAVPEPPDPEVMSIAVAFQIEFQQELDRHYWLIRTLETQESRRLFSTFASEYANLYERKTRADLESSKSYAALAWSCVAAVQFALERTSPSIT